MPDDSLVHLNLQSPNEGSEGQDYIECCKFNIPKNHTLYSHQQKKTKKHSGTWKKTKTGKRKNDDNY